VFAASRNNPDRTGEGSMEALIVDGQARTEDEAHADTGERLEER
jgi:hypothetical protein